ncbi:MAG TPA: UvrD-helicase domain-containing protein, partial [Alphaproteobacteria bacterium]|nr:UvrD-helicase domain-containing protein [Alphaproteobacteria bacterium]
AAAEMLERLYHQLENLETLLEEDLISLLEGVGLTPTKELQKKAKSLFVEVLQKDKFVKIQTVHAFCQSVLETFSLEAGLFPSFQVMDDVKFSSVLENIFTTVLENFPHKESLLCLFTDGHLKKLINEALKLNGMKKFLSSSKESIEEVFIKEGEYCLNPNDYFLKEAALLKPYNKEFLKILEILEQENLTTKTDQDFFYNLKNEPTLNLFLTDSGSKRKRLLCKKVLEKNSDLEDSLETIATALEDEVLSFEKKVYYSKNIVFFGFLKDIFDSLNSYKRRHTYLDFEDIILKTLELFKDPVLGPSVLYSIDQNLNHLLIDEAQDTNPLQWDVISHLTQEFFSHQKVKTVFAVGDPKQSIYSFQGAHPQSFIDLQKNHYKGLCNQSNLPFREIQLSLSYRSSSAILDFVTDLLKSIPLFLETLDQENLTHQAFHLDKPGFVKMLPLVREEKSSEEQPWALTEDDFCEAYENLAKNIVSLVKNLLTKPVLKDQPLPFLPKDIMILVKKRSAFLRSLEKELKANQIPISGLLGTSLCDHLLIKDILSVVQFILYPYDDLNLASLLKSPLFSLSEEDLLHLCTLKSEKETTLWKILKTSFTPFPKASELLKKYLAYGDRLPLYDFFSLVVLDPKARVSLIKEFGKEARNLIQSFLQAVLDFSKSNPSSLELFYDYLKTQEENLSSFSITPETLRILTVHGSKGLQAPVVFVCDACENFQTRTDLFIQENNCFWLNPSKDSNLFQTVKEQKESQELLEHRRLLYVAATRAQNCLYFAGVQKTKELYEECWYNKALNVLKDKEEAFAQWLTDDKSQEPLDDFVDSDALEYLENQDLNVLLPTFAKSLKQTSSQKLGTELHQLFELYHHYDQSSYAWFESKIPLEVKEQLERVDKFSTRSYTEVGFYQKTSNSIKIGRIDVVLRHESAFEIIDYKTTSHKAEEHNIAYEKQLAFYKKALIRLYPSHKVKASLKWVRVSE